MSKTHISVSILPVPDGFVGPAQDALRLSLLLTPYASPTRPDLPVLHDWPAEIRRRLAGLRLFWSGIVDGNPERREDGDPQEIELGAAARTHALPAGATELWQATFPDTALLEDGLANLIDLAGQEANESAALMAPVVDSALLADALIDRRLRRAETAIALATSAPTAPPPTAPGETLMAELQAWAVPGSARDPAGRVRERALVEGRRARNRLAVAAAVPHRRPDAPWSASDYSHSRLQAIYGAACLTCGPDPDLAAAVAATRPRDPLELLSSRLRSVQLAMAAQAASAAAPGAAAGADAQANAELADAIGRKLAAIQSFPTLARHLGIIVDIEIPVSSLPLRYGAITATLGGMPDKESAWTCYVRHDGPSPYFGPCDQIEAAAKSEKRDTQEFVRGLINLAQKKADGMPRYRLVTIDAASAALADQLHARSALEKGGSAGPLPDIAARGIGLLDTDRDEAEAKALTSRKRLQETDFKIHFAADLLRGYRPSIHVSPKTGREAKLSPDRWRSLVARELTFRYLGQDIPRQPIDRDRDDGEVRHMIGVQNDVLLNPQEIFVWTGDSLAVPVTEGGTPGNGYPAAGALQDLGGNLPPVTVTLRLPIDRPGELRGLPPLREGRGYVLGMRAAFVNGCGRTMEDAHQAFASSSDLLLGAERTDGSQPLQAKLFERMSRITAPVLLYPPDEPLATGAPVAQFPGEGLRSLVLRDGNAPPRARLPRRFLYPESVAFERAEQQGQFDAVAIAVPPGALSSDTIKVLRTNEGAFPDAIGSDAEVLKDSQGRPRDIRHPSGPVFRPVPVSTTIAAAPYYPDADAIGVQLQARANVPANATMPRLVQIEYRDSNAPAITAMPVICELRPRPRGRDDDRIDLSVTDETVPNVARKVRKIIVSLAPGTIVDLQLASKVDAQRVAEGHYLRPLFDGTGNSDAAAEVIASLCRQSTVDLLQATGNLRLVHAVKKPLPPSFLRDSLPEGRVDLAAVMFSDGAQTSWDEHVRRYLGRPAADWPSQTGGVSCFFVGRIAVDGPTTGSVSCHAYWQECGPDGVFYRPGESGGPWHYRPPTEQARMFHIDNVDSCLDGGRTVIDLAANAEGVPRKLSFSFRDGRARRLTLDLVSVSRFLDYYPDKSEGDTPRLGSGVDEPVNDSTVSPNSIRPSTEDPCTPPKAPAARPRPGWAEARTHQTAEVWAPCTFRPTPADVRRIMPEFRYTSDVPKDQWSGRTLSLTFERTCVLRVELGPDGFSTGEDERLALVFNNDSNATTEEYLTGMYEQFAGAVTRWGGDPLSGTPVPAALLTRELFVWPDDPWGKGGEDKVYDLPAGPDSEDGSGARGPLRVQVIGYPIKFDCATGTFYAEIALRPDKLPNAYMPFVQLGFARFQPHAIPGQELSYARGQMVQLLPHRKGRVDIRRTNRRGYKLEMTGPVAAPRRHHVEISVVKKMGEGASHWLPAGYSNDYQPVHVLKPEGSGYTTKDWVLITKDRQEHLGLLIEEYEEIRSKSEAGDGSRCEHRLIFGHVVDIGSGRSARQAGPTGPASAGD